MTRTALSFMLLSLLSGCDRLDPLAVVDSPDGMAVMLDTLAVHSGDRVICIRLNVAQSCSRSTAEAIISGGGEVANVDPVWADNRRVIIRVHRGDIKKCAPAALDGSVRIECRKRRVPTTL